MTRAVRSGRYDTFMQHDVQELNRVLVDKLEEKMRYGLEFRMSMRCKKQLTGANCNQRI